MHRARLDHVMVVFLFSPSPGARTEIFLYAGTTSVTNGCVFIALGNQLERSECNMLSNSNGAINVLAPDRPVEKIYQKIKPGSEPLLCAKTHHNSGIGFRARFYFWLNKK